MATTNFGWTTPALGDSNNPPADLTSLANQVDTTLRAQIPLAWSAFATTWSGPTTLSIGNGTLESRWNKVGRLVTATYYLLRGSTTNLGSGNYTFSLPTNAIRYQSVSGAGTIGRSGAFWPVAVAGVATGSIGLAHTDTRARVSNSSMAWADGDEIAFTVVYEAAS